MKSLKYLLLLVPLLLYIFLNMSAVSCSNEPEMLEVLDSVCFDTQVFPIISTSCGSCHGTGASDRDKFDATDYSSIIKSVKPGDSRNSLLYEVLIRTYAGKLMPPDNPLSLEQRTLIQVWIEQGAQNTKCSTGDTTNNGNQKDTVCFKQDIQPIINASCAVSQCHNSLSHVKGYTFTTYEKITENDDAVRPFKPDNSKIYKVLFKTGEDRMPPPPRPALTDEEKGMIRKWIAEGALNSDCPLGICDTENPVSYEKQIWPVVNRSCTGCHNSGSSNAGIILENYTNVKDVANEMRNGKPLLLGVIRWEFNFVAMPPHAKLNACTIRHFEMWIEQGMPNN